MDLKCLGLDKVRTQQLEKLLNYMTWKQKDCLFDELDKVLHDETYKDLDDEICALRNGI